MEDTSMEVDNISYYELLGKRCTEMKHTSDEIPCAGVARDVEDADLKKAYRKAAMKWYVQHTFFCQWLSECLMHRHPDKP